MLRLFRWLHGRKRVVIRTDNPLDKKLSAWITLRIKFIRVENPSDKKLSAWIDGSARPYNFIRVDTMILSY
jgi:hypothetical protein